MKKLISVFLALILCLSTLPMAALAAESATTIQLMETEGTVEVFKPSGGKAKVVNKMRLYSGYRVKTGSGKSAAWVSLDSSKLVKLDANSEVTLHKSGKKIELLVNSGNLLFNVTEPLKSDETMNVRTSTMVAGIRGTCGYVSARDGGSSLSLLHGEVVCFGVGGGAGVPVRPGQSVSFDASPAPGHTPAPASLSLEDLPGFVQVAVAADAGLAAAIEAATGLTVTDITPAQAAEKLEQDVKAADEAAAEVDAQVAAQDEASGTVDVPAASIPEGAGDPTTGAGSGAGGDTGSSSGGSTGGGFDWGFGWGGFDPPAPSTPAPSDPPAPSAPPVVTYTVTFNSRVGAPTTQTVTAGGKATAPAAPTWPDTGSGISFGGWYTSLADAMAANPPGSAFDFANTEIAGNTTLYARWVDSSNRPVWVVKPDPNGGTLNASVPSVHGVADGETLDTSNTDPTRDGHTFGGWYTDAACTNEWTATATVTADTTLYAKWTPNNYTVTFNLIITSITPPDSQSVQYGGKVTKPTDPIRDGYTFGGWYKETGCTNEWNFTTDTVTAATTLYAKWIYNTGDLMVFGGSAGTDYKYENTNVLTVLTAAPLRIYMKSGVTTAKTAIVINAANANVTLNNVNIDIPSTREDHALMINDTATIRMVGENSLRSDGKGSSTPENRYGLYISDCQNVIFTGETGSSLTLKNGTENGKGLSNAMFKTSSNGFTIGSGATFKLEGKMNVESRGPDIENGGKLIVLNGGYVFTAGGLEIKSGGTLEVQSGGGLESNGLISVAGTLNNSGTLTVNSTLTVEGTIDVSGMTTAASGTGAATLANGSFLKYGGLSIIVSDSATNGINPDMSTNEYGIGSSGGSVKVYNGATDLITFTISSGATVSAQSSSATYTIKP